MYLKRVGIVAGSAALSGIGFGLGAGAVTGLCAAGAVSTLAERIFNAWHEDSNRWYSPFARMLGNNYYEKLCKRDSADGFEVFSLSVMVLLPHPAVKICSSIFLILLAIFADIGLKK